MRDSQPRLSSGRCPVFNIALLVCTAHRRRERFPSSRGEHEYDGHSLQRQGGPAVRDHDRGLGHRRHAGRRPDRGATAVARPAAPAALPVLQPAAAAAHQRGDLRVRRQRAVRDLLLHRAAHLPRPAVRGQAGRVHVLGLAAGDPARGDHAAARHHHQQGIRRARVADRHPDRRRVGRLRGGVLRHDRAAQGQAHLRRELVLRGVHHHDRGAAHHQQPGDPGHADEVVLRLPRRGRRDGAVVVRAQRGGLLPDRGLPRHDVLLRAEAGGASRLLLPAVGGALLGADRHLHVGRPAPPALHDAARLGAVARHGVLADPARAVVGRHDQRHHDPLRRVA